MQSNDNNPLTKIAEGVVRAGIKEVKQDIKNLVEKFFNKDLSFVEDDRIIKKAKEQRRRSEWEIFKGYIKERDLRVQFIMGLTLREMEKEKQDFEPVKKNIKKKYDSEGLARAYFVQNKLFTKYHSILLERGVTKQEMKEEIKRFFLNIKQNTAFINTYESFENQLA